MSGIEFYITHNCVKCGACAIDCPVNCIVEGESQFMIGEACIRCGDCYSICPVGAVQMKSIESD